MKKQIFLSLLLIGILVLANTGICIADEINYSKSLVDQDFSKIKEPVRWLTVNVEYPAITVPESVKTAVKLAVEKEIEEVRDGSKGKAIKSVIEKYDKKITGKNDTSDKKNLERLNGEYAKKITGISKGLTNEVKKIWGKSLTTAMKTDLKAIKVKKDKNPKVTVKAGEFQLAGSSSTNSVKTANSSSTAVKTGVITTDEETEKVIKRDFRFLREPKGVYIRAKFKYPPVAIDKSIKSAIKDAIRDEVEAIREAMEDDAEKADKAMNGDQAKDAKQLDKLNKAYKSDLKGVPGKLVNAGKKAWGLEIKKKCYEEIKNSLATVKNKNEKTPQITITIDNSDRLFELAPKSEVEKTENGGTETFTMKLIEQDFNFMKEPRGVMAKATIVYPAAPIHDSVKSSIKTAITEACDELRDAIEKKGETADKGMTGDEAKDASKFKSFNSFYLGKVKSGTAGKKLASSGMKAWGVEIKKEENKNLKDSINTIKDKKKKNPQITVVIENDKSEFEYLAKGAPDPVVEEEEDSDDKDDDPKKSDDDEDEDEDNGTAKSDDDDDDSAKSDDDAEDVEADGPSKYDFITKTFSKLKIPAKQVVVTIDYRLFDVEDNLKSFMKTELDKIVNREIKGTFKRNLEKLITSEEKNIKGTASAKKEALVKLNQAVEAEMQKLKKTISDGMGRAWGAVIKKDSDLYEEVKKAATAYKYPDYKVEVIDFTLK